MILTMADEQPHVDAVALGLASEKPIAVIDSTGRSIGAIDRAAMIRGLSPDERA